jgi:hypothetical protein
MTIKMSLGAFLSAAAFTAGAILVSAMPMTGAHAADGTLGSTSNATSTLSVTLPDRVVIKDVDNLTFSGISTWDGTADVTDSDNVCVYSTTGGYNVTADGDNAANANNEFKIADGSGNLVAYTVEFAGTSGAGSGTSIPTPGTPVTGFTVSGGVTASCSSNNATFLVSLLNSNGGDDLLNAPSGAYSGTLTLTVAPE